MYKTHILKWNRADAGHNVNSARDQAYSEHGPIDGLIETLVIKSSERFWLLHARQPRHALLTHGIMKHAGYRGRKPSTGQCKISVPLGEYSMWLTGEEPQRAVPVQCTCTRRAPQLLNP